MIKMNATMTRKLGEIRAAGTGGIVVRDLLASLDSLHKLGLITIEEHEPITRHGAPSTNYLIKAVPTKEQLWQAYEAACEARHAHIHVERCETCWGAQTASCQGWNELTSKIYVARDRWLACD